eukprot:COSAG06_NODE_100_length_24132_cov_93.237507_11_plen_58_part_00
MRADFAGSHRGGVGRVLARLSDDGTKLVSAGSDDGTVRLWNVATGEREQILWATADV